MNKTVNFRVDPRLAALLGESYRSSEIAIKELVDNAWDAEAEEVKIELPDLLSDRPVVVRDNGSGMKSNEVESEYLNIASPRFSRKGEFTPVALRIPGGAWVRNVGEKRSGGSIVEPKIKRLDRP